MRKVILLSCCFCLYLQLNAQTTSPEVVAVSGGFYSTPSASLSFTTGECATETYTGSSIITQGFQQTMLTVTHRGKSLKQPELSVFPNPTSDIITITFGDTENALEEIRVLDISGRMLETQQCPSGTRTVRLNTRAWPSGVYFLKVKCARGSNSYKIEKIN